MSREDADGVREISANRCRAAPNTETRSLADNCDQRAISPTSRPQPMQIRNVGCRVQIFVQGVSIGIART